VYGFQRSAEYQRWIVHLIARERVSELAVNMMRSITTLRITTTKSRSLMTEEIESWNLSGTDMMVLITFRRSPEATALLTTKPQPERKYTYPQTEVLFPQEPNRSPIFIFIYMAGYVGRTLDVGSTIQEDPNRRKTFRQA